MKLKSLLITFMFCFAACSANATIDTRNIDDPKSKKDIGGGVVHADTKKPLSHVNVSAYIANKKEKTALTDGSGNYYFNDLKPGTYKLVFEKDGFKKVVKEKIAIRSDEGCQLNIEMDENEPFQILPGLLFTDFN